MSEVGTGIFKGLKSQNMNRENQLIVVNLLNDTCC